MHIDSDDGVFEKNTIMTMMMMMMMMMILTIITMITIIIVIMITNHLSGEWKASLYWEPSGLVVNLNLRCIILSLAVVHHQAMDFRTCC